MNSERPEVVLPSSFQNVTEGPCSAFLGASRSLSLLLV